MNKMEIAKSMIESELKMREEELREDREQIMKIAERGSADEIIAWANNMKETERRIYALKEQMKLIEFIINNK